jgi:suppressor of fused-like protein
MGEVDETPGWAAIDAALQPIYGDVEPMHWGTLVRWRQGGPDPLDRISCYRRTDPVPHWHFVSYGLTELYEKESVDPDAGAGPLVSR